MATATAALAVFKISAVFKIDLKNDTQTKPPMFSPIGYETWEIRMGYLLRNQDVELQGFVEQGLFVYMVAAIGEADKMVSKEPSKFSE